jgi:hypothetical protein
MIRTAVLLRGCLVLVLLLVGLVDAYGYVVGRDAVVMAPVLAPHRAPLYLALFVGALLVLAGVRVAFDLTALVGRGETFSTAGLGLLRRLRDLLWITAVYLLVCVVGMSVVIDRGHLGMPGVWLAAFVGEVASLSTIAGVSYLIHTQTPGHPRALPNKPLRQRA